MFDFLLGNDGLSALIAFILVLIPAVIVHELGHFAAAKWVGITILEFGIGMPPRMLKLFTIGGTDYTLNWLPLGGFVRPLGEDMVRQMGDEALATDRQEAEARGIKKTMSVGEAKPLARILFLSGGALVNFAFALILFVIIGLIGIPQYNESVISIRHIQAGSSLAEAGLQENDVITSVNGETFGTVELLLAKIASGEPLVIDVLRPQTGEADVPVTLNSNPLERVDAPTVATYPIIGNIAPDSPAQAAGLESGDIVTAFNGEPLVGLEQLQTRTGESLGELVTLTVLRGDDQLEVTLTPRTNPPAGQGSIGVTISDAYRSDELGLSFQGGLRSVLVPLGIGEAISYSLERVGSVFSTIAAIPGQILGGTAEPDSLRITSPLGISQVGGFFLQESIQRNQPTIILEFMALISVALGLTNLLPIPALDGGRILFVLIEIVRGRPISPEREGMVHLVGLALLLSLMVVVLFNDIANPLTDLLR